MPFMLSLLLLAPEPVRPVRTEMLLPYVQERFNPGGNIKSKIQGGNPQSMPGGILTFDGSNDGDRQVDPQIAVGGGFVLHGTNSGLYIYDKSGKPIDGVPQRAFRDGIDPKLFYNAHTKAFGFDLWVYWDEAKVKPVNISVSKTADPRGAWHTYSVPAPQGVDGGGIGYSRKWIGYSFPGGPTNTFVMRMADAQAGRSAQVWHFAGSLGHPVYTQDAIDDLHFVALTDQEIIIRRVRTGPQGEPFAEVISQKPHRFQHFGWPPAAPQKGTEKTVAPGDRNPKNLVVQNGHLWFSHTVNVNGRAGVQWHQVRLDGTFVQSGLLSDPVNSFIQTTLAVNRRGDVLVGFQETGPNMFVSPRFAYRRAGDKPGTMRPMVKFGEGKAATAGGPWGDYSGSVVDGDNKRDLWTVQSIANEQGRGSTKMARLALP